MRYKKVKKTEMSIYNYKCLLCPSNVSFILTAFSELNHIEDAYFDPNFDGDLEEKVILLAPTKPQLSIVSANNLR